MKQRRIPKKYGQSKIPQCPFCEKQATVRNSQGLPVCKDHRANKLTNINCVCGEQVEVLVGKWGPYVRCPTCGNVNLKKVLELGI